MSDEEEKQKLVNGFEHLLQIYSDELQVFKDLFDSLSEEQLSVFRNWRQYFVAAISFFATFIVSLANFEPIRSSVGQLLILTIPIGLGSFIVFTIFRNIASITFGKIDDAYLEIKSNLYFIRGFLGSLAPNFNKYQVESIRLMSEYITATYLNRTNLWYAYHKASQSILIWQKRKALQVDAERQFQYTNISCMLFNKWKQEISNPELDKKFFKFLLNSSNTVQLQNLSYYMKKIEDAYSNSISKKEEIEGPLSQIRSEIQELSSKQGISKEQIEMLNKKISDIGQKIEAPVPENRKL